MTTLTQNRMRAVYRNLSIACLVAFAMLLALARVTHLPVHWAAMAAAAAAGVFSLLQFYVLDETAKQAHYIAWYWGGLVGLVVLMLTGFAFAADALPFAWVEQAAARMLGAFDAKKAFLFGLLSGPIAMFLGFAVWWSAHWLRLRNGGEQ
jgi:hypothetical protein